MEQTPTSMVHLLHDSLVTPLNPTTRHRMYLSLIDQGFRKAPPSRTILFYRTNNIDPSFAFDALRHAIASTLVLYYPLAGRLLKEEDEDGCLAIDCNDQGVQLIQARCHLPFAEFERNNFVIQPLFQQLVPMAHRESSDHLDDPLAAFQVTGFEGGLAVGIAVLHSVADGHAVWNFIQAVGRACRNKPLSVYPLHARVLLKPEVFNLGTSFPNLHCEDPSLNVAVSLSGDQNPTPESLHHKVIHFNEEMLEALKKACLSSITLADIKKSGFIMSTYQALSAYLWKRLTLAQKLHDADCVNFSTLVDVRRRMIPPLTSAFFGNAVVRILMSMTVKELLSESLGDIAWRIRQSIQRGDDAYIKKSLIAREKIDLRKSTLTRMKLMGIRNASGFPVYEASNFGWGEPYVVRPPHLSREGEFTWYPGKQPKSMDVIASLSEATCANFFSPQLYPKDPLHSSFPFSTQI
ncbi:hypothetical protein GOP47_0027558 [Adiantum capillus-veneris]|nr:hypothetical protein GOP47_0027558 [Adiantum capillus-veneris]